MTLGEAIEDLAEQYREFEKGLSPIVRFMLKVKRSKFNNQKYMKTILTDQEVKDMFSCANRNTQVMLRELFGDEQLGLKGNGVWCLDSEGNLVDRKEWDKHSMTPHGAVVITKECAFVVAPHNTVVAQFSAQGKGKGLVTLETNKDSLDCHSATNRIVKEYEGIKHTDKDGDSQFDFIGAPAAEFCENYSVDSSDSRAWCLPTVKQLQIMSEHLKEINACLLAMGCPPVIPGCYWSSIVKDEWCAWYVDVYGGSTYYGLRSNSIYVRAVSAFRY